MSINRLIPAFACALALLISTCPTVQAEFKGQMRRDLDWSLNVDNSSTTGGTANQSYTWMSEGDSRVVFNVE